MNAIMLIEDFDLGIVKVRIVDATAEFQLDLAVVEHAAHDERRMIEMGCDKKRRGRGFPAAGLRQPGDDQVSRPIFRSEERRVGIECRCLSTLFHYYRNSYLIID